MKTLVFVICMQVAACSALFKGVTRKYDPYENKTVVEARWVDATAGVNVASLSAKLECIGDNVDCMPDSVRVEFKALNTGWKFKDSHDVRLKIEGESVPTGNIQYVGDYGYGVGVSPELGRPMIASEAKEYVFFTLSLQVFERLANAKYVKGTIGPHTFESDYSSRYLFRDLLQRRSR